MTAPTEEKVREEDIAKELDDLKSVEDDDSEESSFKSQFNISSFGADYNVDSLVKRMKSGAFYKPSFQREYVWSQRQASRFIESLLMGLPVPGIFVYRLSNGKHLIVDGLQRLITLEWYYKQLFRKDAFELVDVRDPWAGKRYEDLDESDRLRLDDAIVHTTIFKQDFPDKGDKSVYEVFERINTGGIKLSPQEIRVCVNYSENQQTSFVSLLRKLNEDARWREIFGPQSLRLKDQELILRFLALENNIEAYQRPLRGFLDDFIADHRDITADQWSIFSNQFLPVIEAVRTAIGTRAFRPESALNGRLCT